MDADANRQRPRPQPRSRGRAAQSDFPGDSDYADPGRRTWPVALGVAVLGLVLGLLAGLVYSATEAKTYEATTSISVLPDPDLDFSNTGNNNTTQDATAFIQSQLVVVNGADLADRVRSQLNLAARPSVEATQVGQTYVVSIVATASSRDEAVAVATRTAAGYDAVRTRQLTSNVNTLLKATNRQLTTVSNSLNSSRQDARQSDPLTPSQTALQTEYERLLSQRSSLTGVQSQVAGIVTVVAPARATDSGLSTAARNILIGALLGALVALALFVVFRRSVRRIRTVADLSALGLVTILPVQSRRPLRRNSRRPDTAARLLAARLDPELTTGEPLVFVGVTGGAGADRVSTAVAAALTDRGQVLYLPRPTNDDAGSTWLSGLGTEASTAEFFDRLKQSDVPGVWLPDASSPADESRATRVSRTAHIAAIFRHAQRRGFVVVLEADPISESDMAVDCGRAGASIVLVVARDSSSPADVVVATELFAAQSVTFLGAVLNEAPGLLTRVVQRPGLLTPRGFDEPAVGAHRNREKSVTDEVVAPPAETDTLAGSEPTMDDAGHELLGYGDPELTDTRVSEPAGDGEDRHHDTDGADVVLDLESSDEPHDESASHDGAETEGTDLNGGDLNGGDLNGGGRGKGSRRNTLAWRHR